ncbi:glycosyltransferase [Mariniflexile ostreae]|uniref:Glycosyltransferase n=1 Tax=Mariniflexile ostreae TaxID=1520892 RepID=A0ABV5FC84_9FLAO
MKTYKILRVALNDKQKHHVIQKHAFAKYIQRFWINRLATKITILTQHDYNILGKLLSNKVVIQNPLSFPIYKEQNLRRKNILAVGSLDRWEGKGFDNLIFVWGKIATQYPSWILEIAGTGSTSSYDYLLELCKKNNVENRVHFIGFQPNIDTVMRESSIFVLSSKFEGLPMALIEAMSQGCACISFDCISGPREIMTDGESGILVENQNLNKLEEALVSLIEDEKLRLELSCNAIKDVEKFIPENIAKQWKDMFDEILKDK